MFFHYATRKITPICKILTFFEDLSFLNPRPILNQSKRLYPNQQHCFKTHYFGSEISIKNTIKSNFLQVQDQLIVRVQLYQIYTQDNKNYQEFPPFLLNLLFYQFPIFIKNLTSPFFASFSRQLFSNEKCKNINTWNQPFL